MKRLSEDFCGDLNKSKSCHAIIQRCDTDKFRPLVNYLRGRSESTDEKNIELLAWLIDFPGRPWELGKTYSDDDDENGTPALNDWSLPATEDRETAPDFPATPSAAGNDQSNRKSDNSGKSSNSIPAGWLKKKEGVGVKVAETSNPKKN